MPVAGSSVVGPIVYSLRAPRSRRGRPVATSITKGAAQVVALAVQFGFSEHMRIAARGAGHPITMFPLPWESPNVSLVQGTWYEMLNAAHLSRFPNNGLRGR